MSEEGPRYSEDGKFYWDGQRWAPVTVAIRPSGFFQQGAAHRVVSYGCGCVVALILLAVFLMLFGTCARPS